MSLIGKPISPKVSGDQRKGLESEIKVLQEGESSFCRSVEAECATNKVCVVKPEWTSFIANFAIGECASNEGVSIQYNGLASKIFIHHYGHADNPNKLNKLRE